MTASHRNESKFDRQKAQKPNTLMAAQYQLKKEPAAAAFTL
jgi:hypothetical protein